MTLNQKETYYIFGKHAAYQTIGLLKQANPWIGAGIGAALGGLGGAMTGAPGVSPKRVLGGALAGAAGGALGGHWFRKNITQPFSQMNFKMPPSPVSNERLQQGFNNSIQNWQNIIKKYTK